MPIAVGLMMFALPGSAVAAVTASSDASRISVVGTAGDDGTVLIDEGANLRITSATAGSGCSQSAADALCPRGSRTINATLSGGNDSLTNQSVAAATVFGGSGDDRLRGGPNNDALIGDEGDDRFVSPPGPDTMSGGGGIDTLDYSDAPAGIHAWLPSGGGLAVRESGGTIDRMKDEFENVIGTFQADVLRGGPKANNLSGGSGGDVIDGGDGDDSLEGGSGSDRFGRVASSVPVTASASSIDVGNADHDGKDTLLGGSGNDDMNARDQQLDQGIDCGTGFDTARQDLADDEGDLDIDNCETTETTAIDQRAMTRIVRVRKRGERLRVTLACPKRSRVRCKGRAALAGKPKGKRGSATGYAIGKGKRRRITVSGFSRRRRYLVLTEKDQRGRVRRLVSRVR